MTKEHAYAYEAGYQDGLRAATDELNAENAKLRELLRDTLIQTDQYCDKYGIEYEDGADAWDKANADIDRRLSELGVVG